MLFGDIIHDLCWNNARANCDAKKVTLWTGILLDKEKLKLDSHAQSSARRDSEMCI